MDNFLSINQMASLFNFIKHCLKVAVPVSEHSFCISVFLFECHFPCQSINPSLDSLVNNHVADFRFSSVFWNTNKFRKRLNLYFTIVLLNNSEVMLDQLTKEVSHVSFVIFCCVNKWIKGGHLVLNFFFVKGHELIC